MAYIPHMIRAPTHDADCIGDGACGVEGGRKNGGRRKKKHMRKRKNELAAYV
jgi:hypothetical protein